MERRKRRSAARHIAVNYYLETLRQQEGLEALALSDDQGLPIGGAGALDLEEMSAVGAAAPKGVLPWNSRTLHVTRLMLRGHSVVLTATGRKVPSGTCAEPLSRILG